MWGHLRPSVPPSCFPSLSHSFPSFHPCQLPLFSSMHLFQKIRSCFTFIYYIPHKFVRLLFPPSQDEILPTVAADPSANVGDTTTPANHETVRLGLLVISVFTSVLVATLLESRFTHIFSKFFHTYWIFFVLNVHSASLFEPKCLTATLRAGAHNWLPSRASPIRYPYIQLLVLASQGRGPNRIQYQ